MNEENNTNQVLNRLKIALNLRPDAKDAELANAINMSKSTLSTWRQRDSTPYEICVKIAKERGINLNWLLTGEGGEMYLNTITQEMQLDPEEQAVLRIMKKMDRAQKTTIRANAENIEQIIELKQQVSALTMQQSA